MKHQAENPSNADHHHQQQQQQQHENSAVVSSSLFQSANEMTWTIPSDISQRRFSECDGRKVSKTGGFCLTRESNKKVRYAGADPTLATFLESSIFPGKTVVDLGAGKGYYGKIFRRDDSPVAGWVGYDGALNVEEVTSGLVRFMDLTQPDAADTRPCVKGDWVLSLEVGEHIDRKYMESYLRNVRCHSREGAVISWARPTQTGGLNHVNMMEDDDVDKALARWGFVKDAELTRQARNSASFKHFKNTASVYRVVSA